jgi:hypothetical protein
MSAYQLNELVQKWEKGDLSSEQAIGQLMLQVQELSARMGALEKRLEPLRQQKKTLVASQPVEPQPNLVAFDLDLLQRAQKLAGIRGLNTESLMNLLLEQRLHQLEAKEEARD